MLCHLLLNGGRLIDTRSSTNRGTLEERVNVAMLIEILASIVAAAARRMRLDQVD